MIRAGPPVTWIAWGIIIALTLLGCDGNSQIDGPDDMAMSPVARYRLTTDRLFSQHVDDVYDLLLYLPPEDKLARGRYPVVYVLDMAFQGQQQAIDDALATLAQDVIVVGLGNPEQRDRDYTPDRGASTPEGHGGAANFYNFLVDELIPYIDANYDTDGVNRTLIGHAYGGLFTLFALLSQEPEQRYFNAFIASSPALGFAADLLADMEASMYARSRELPVTLHLSAGREGRLTEACRALATLLVSRGYDQLYLMMSEFPVSRIGNIAPSYRQGLQLIYGAR